MTPSSRSRRVARARGCTIRYDRPTDIFAGNTTLHTGSGREAYLLLPVIPADRPGVRTTKPVMHNGKDDQIAR